MRNTILLLLLMLVAVSIFSCKNGNNKNENVDLIIEDTTEIIIEKAAILFKDLDFVTGKFEPSKHDSFVWVDTRYTDKPYIYLQKETYDQFLKMREDAARDSVDLFILSAARSFDYQKRIWERKWQKLVANGWTNEREMAAEILKYSAMPGTSRHHWGTDIDLNYLSNSWFEAGKGKKIYDWLLLHAADYGFFQPYTPKGDERHYGYEEEKWHWSYLPLANQYFRSAEAYLTDSLITGFSGAQSSVELQVVSKYILSIDPLCKRVIE